MFKRIGSIVAAAAIMFGAGATVSAPPAHADVYLISPGRTFIDINGGGENFTPTWASNYNTRCNGTYGFTMQNPYNYDIKQVSSVQLFTKGGCRNIVVYTTTGKVHAWTNLYNGQIVNLTSVAGFNDMVDRIEFR